MVRCGESRKNNASDPVSKTATATAASKRGSPNSRLASVYYIQNNALPWKQCHVTTLLSSMISACAQRSDKWGVPVPNLSLLVMLCLVFVGVCIGKVINFKWLSKNKNADASKLIRKAKFIVTVVGPVTLLSTDAASTVARFREH